MTQNETSAPELAELEDIDAKLKALDNAERAIDSAYGTGKAERAKITQMAQLDAAEAVAMAGIAMEADVEADEAMRISVIAEKSGDRERARTARKREREARKRASNEHKQATRSAKKAYNAIKFSAPNRMGFMRVVQVLFAIHIASVLIFLMLTSRDAMKYNVSTMMDWLMVILEGVAFWMFINRYKIGRPFVIGMAAIGLIVPAAFDVATGHFNPFALSINGAFYFFLIIYFAFSQRVKATLVNDFSQHTGVYEKDDFVINRHGWPFIRNLIIYFIVFSIVGHWMEMGMCQFIIMGLVEGEYDPSNTMLWRDWLYPFPMEGAAVVVIALVLYPFFLWLKEKFPGKKRWVAYVLSFFSGALLCTFIEGGMGLIVNSDLQLWDYRDNFMNIGGQVCLQNTTAFGVMASIITWFVYPMLERWIARVPRDIMNIAAIVIFVFGAIVWSLYLINPPGVDEHNKHPEQAEQILQDQARKAADDERNVLVEESDTLVEETSAMRYLIDESNALSDADKEKALAKIDTINKDAQELRNGLANAELNNAASSSKAAPSGEAASSVAASSGASSDTAASSGSPSSDAATSTGAATSSSAATSSEAAPASSEAASSTSASSAAI